MKSILLSILFVLIIVAYFFYPEPLKKMETITDISSDRSIESLEKIFKLNELDYINEKKSINKTIPDLPVSDPLNMDTSISDIELLELARVAIQGDDPALKPEAFDLLINLSQSEAALFLNTLAMEKVSDPYIAQMVIRGMLHFQLEKDLLTDDNIKNLYELDDPIIKKLAAQIMSDRGDNSLADLYVESFDSGFPSKQPEVRLQTLFEVSALKKFNALPQIKTSLKDPDSAIRLQALNFLGAYGNDMDILAAESLLGDSHPQVRAQAQLVVKNLWHKNSHHVMTENQEFAPPGDLY